MITKDAAECYRMGVAFCQLPVAIHPHRAGGGGHGGRSPRIVVRAIGGDGKSDLPKIAGTTSGLRRTARLVQRRQQHGGQNGNDRNNNKQFNQRKFYSAHFPYLLSLIYPAERGEFRISVRPTSGYILRTFCRTFLIFRQVRTISASSAVPASISSSPTSRLEIPSQTSV